MLAQSRSSSAKRGGLAWMLAQGCSSSHAHTHAHTHARTHTHTHTNPAGLLLPHPLEKSRSPLKTLSSMTYCCLPFPGTILSLDVPHLRLAQLHRSGELETISKLAQTVASSFQNDLRVTSAVNVVQKSVTFVCLRWNPETLASGTHLLHVLQTFALPLYPW